MLSGRIYRNPGEDQSNAINSNEVMLNDGIMLLDKVIERAREHAG
ncbi:uncharacterized protein FRV6_02626 [Fusarium oxysporum]|uniref:Uncharacterized protein n=1 Tax=Fusarium oxysporum TaxID=5507 RepID=A0A2H3T9K0_FUSOX|nr:uncharacterized protein FRV6_02626 [Fusarium oxysporum]